MTEDAPTAGAGSEAAAAGGAPEARSALSTFERTEKKYLLDREQYQHVRRALAARCHEDDFAYSTISSLYYDDAQFSMINRSIERPLYKQKIRVRAYASCSPETMAQLGAPVRDVAATDAPAGTDTSGVRDDAVFVELKKKFKGITYKRRFPATARAARAFLAGEGYERVQADYPLAEAGKRASCLSWKNVQIAREIRETVAQYGRIEPKIMVVVDRVALRADDRSDLRITFDLNSRYRTDRLRFSDGLDGEPLFDGGAGLSAYAIMEVKCAEAYPLWLVELLSRERLYCRACSKVGNAYMLSHRTQAPAAARALERSMVPRATARNAKVPGAPDAPDMNDQVPLGLPILHQ